MKKGAGSAVLHSRRLLSQYTWQGWQSEVQTLQPLKTELDERHYIQEIRDVMADKDTDTSDAPND